MRRRIVIVGASLAGATAAATLRQEGFDGEIVLVGAEAALPFERPALSKQYLRGEMPFEKMLVRPEAFYRTCSTPGRTRPPIGWSCAGAFESRSFLAFYLNADGRVDAVVAMNRGKVSGARCRSSHRARSSIPGGSRTKAWTCETSPPRPNQRAGPRMPEPKAPATAVGSAIEAETMRYDFLIDSYETERLKILSVWSEFHDDDLPVRPKPDDPRGRSVLEHMVHQCVSEDTWFRTMLGIDVGAPPLPAEETRLAFIERYAEDSGRRLDRLRQMPESWWEEATTFFDVQRTRAWVMTRRLTHSSHHRGQQMAMLRMLGRELHSNYGPTADTGGLMQNRAPTIYAYASLNALIEGESRGGAKAPLPGAPPGVAVTERPGR